MCVQPHRFRWLSDYIFKWDPFSGISFSAVLSCGSVSLSCSQHSKWLWPSFASIRWASFNRTGVKVCVHYSVSFSLSLLQIILSSQKYYQQAVTSMKQLILLFSSLEGINIKNFCIWSTVMKCTTQFSNNQFKMNFQIHVFTCWGGSVVWSQCKTLKLFEPRVKYSVVLLWKLQFPEESAQSIRSC